MAKRFIDTGLFDDSWFMDLSSEGKILWIYCITKCDHAGILLINKKLAQVQTGITSLETVIKELDNHLLRLNELLFFIPKFVEYQYPGFPNSKVRQQQSAVNILSKYGLIKNNKLTVSKELPNSYGNGHENGHGNGIDINKDTTLKEEAKFDYFKLKSQVQVVETIYKKTVLSKKFPVTIDKFNQLLDDFIALRQMDDKPPRNQIDYTQHFENWVTIQVKKPENHYKTMLVL